MPKFRKKPVVIEARLLTANIQDVELAKWCDGIRTSYGMIIDTLEGPMRADFGAWIIQGVYGEFYPCKPDIFEKTYEPVEPPQKPSSPR